MPGRRNRYGYWVDYASTVEDAPIDAHTSRVFWRVAIVVTVIGVVAVGVELLTN
jgi:hypothetical protein